MSSSKLDSKAISLEEDLIAEQLLTSGNLEQFLEDFSQTHGEEIALEIKALDSKQKLEFVKNIIKQTEKVEIEYVNDLSQLREQFVNTTAVENETSLSALRKEAKNVMAFYDPSLRKIVMPTPVSYTHLTLPTTPYV